MKEEKLQLTICFKAKREKIYNTRLQTRTSYMSRYCEYLSRILKLCVIEKQSHQPTNVYEALIEN